MSGDGYPWVVTLVWLVIQWGCIGLFALVMWKAIKRIFKL